jgi:hypothetical protein
VTLGLRRVLLGLSGQPASDLLAAAEKHWPEAKLGKVPPLRDIQAALSVGQPKAQQVQAHFRQLQAASQAA